jgi:hypothetical protein
MFNQLSTKRLHLLKAFFLSNYFSILSVLLFTQLSYAQTNYKDEIELWHSNRIQNLKSETGWLNLAGLEWLKEKNLTVERIDVVKKLNTLASNLDMTLPILGLAWCLKNPNVSTVIIGASKEYQLIENLKSLDAKEKLTAEVMEEIELILNNKPKHPDH